MTEFKGFKLTLTYVKLLTCISMSLITVPMFAVLMRHMLV